MRGTIHPQEFKDSTVQLVINSGEAVLKIAKDLDINPKTIYNWPRIYKKSHNISTYTPIADIQYKKGEDFQKGSQPKRHKSSIIKESLESENRGLRAENKLLKQERDILNKATAYIYTTTQSKAYRSIYCENSHTLAKETL